MRPIRSRLARWAPIAAGVAVVAAIAVVALAVSGWITLGEALVLFAVAAVGGVVCVLGVLERRFRLALPGRIEQIVDERLALAVDERIAPIVEAKGIDDYEQLVAWAELQRALSPAVFMPRLRGWAASPDVIRILARTIDATTPDLVVECGSGSSSVWIGYALRRAGRGRLVALEHDAQYAELSRALVAAHGLDDVVEVRLAPLVDQPVGGAAPQPWYDPSAIADLDGIGVLFVDGPPGHIGPFARYPALPFLLGRCAPEVTIVLDDAARPDERAVGDRWLADDPRLRRRSEPAEKGADIFTLSSQAPLG